MLARSPFFPGVFLGLLVAFCALTEAQAAPKRPRPKTHHSAKNAKHAPRQKAAEEPEKPAPSRLLVDRRGASPTPDDSKESRTKKTRAVHLSKLPNLDIHARDLRATDEGKERLVRIAARFHEKTGERLVITGGWRSARRQAQLMIDKLTHGDDMVGLYENKAAAREIEDAYAARQKGSKKLRLGTLDAVQQVIEAQMARGVFASRHLQAGAVDIKSRGLSPQAIEALIAAVAADTEVALLDEREAAEPHFHLSIPGE